MKITTAKKILVGLGLGLGLAMSSVSYSAPSCRTLLYQCDNLGSYQACVEYMRFCGPIP